MTPYEFVLSAQAHAKRISDRQNDLIKVAWLTEAFARQKQLPKLEKLLSTENKPPKKRKSIDEAILAAKSLGLKVPQMEVKS